MIISTLGGRRENDLQGALSDVCPTVDERVKQVTTVVRARESKH